MVERERGAELHGIPPSVRGCTHPNQSRAQNRTLPTHTPHSEQKSKWCASPPLRAENITYFRPAPSKVCFERGGAVTWTGRGKPPRLRSGLIVFLPNGQLAPGRCLDRATYPFKSIFGNEVGKSTSESWENL